MNETMTTTTVLDDKDGSEPFTVRKYGALVTVSNEFLDDCERFRRAWLGLPPHHRIPGDPADMVYFPDMTLEKWFRSFPHPDGAAPSGV